MAKLPNTGDQRRSETEVCLDSKMNALAFAVQPASESVWGHSAGTHFLTLTMTDCMEIDAMVL